MANVPGDLKYAASHEWMKLDGDQATIGITDFAQSELGDVVYVELPNVGRVLAAGDGFGSVESVKTVSDIYSPVAGEVIEVNGALGAQSELINEDPYGKGWLIKLRVSDASAADSMLDAAEYTASIS
jgi:glycine cleavage system H protein